MKIRKIFKNTVFILAGLVISMYACTSYAKPTISNVVSVSKSNITPSGGKPRATVTDTLDGNLFFHFDTSTTAGAPKEILFFVYEYEGANPAERIIESEAFEYHAENGRGSSAKYVCNFTAKLKASDIKNDAYKNYEYDILVKGTTTKEESAKTVINELSDHLPELSATIEKSNGNRYILNVKNNSDEFITITKITGDKYVDATPNNLPEQLELGQDHKIELRPTKNATRTYKATVTIEYTVTDNVIKSEIVLDIVNDGIAENCTDTECPKQQDKNPAQERPDPIYIYIQPEEPEIELLTLEEIRTFSDAYTGETQTAKYLITNNSDQELPLKISTLEQPIYRDDATYNGEKSCGTSIAAGEKCVVKLALYPTEAGDIDQQLRISSDQLNSDLIQDIKVTVEEDDAFLKVTPINDNNSIESVIDIEQKSIKLKYRLENLLDNDLEITSIRVPITNVADHDPDFKVEKGIKKLSVNETGQIELSFTPKAERNLEKNLYKTLVVRFKEKGKKKIYLVKVPIIIKKANIID